MEDLLKDLQCALDAGLFLVALATTLTLPDICSALSSSNGQTDGVKYRDWVDRWLTSPQMSLSGKEVYQLRCGYLHQGRSVGEHSKFTRVIFVPPNDRHVFLHNMTIQLPGGEIVFALMLRSFCEQVIEAVRAWYNAMKGSANVLTNIDTLVRLRPNGLFPVVEGFAVIS